MKKIILLILILILSIPSIFAADKPIEISITNGETSGDIFKYLIFNQLSEKNLNLENIQDKGTDLKFIISGVNTGWLSNKDADIKYSVIPKENPGEIKKPSTIELNIKKEKNNSRNVYHIVASVEYDGETKDIKDVKCLNIPERYPNTYIRFDNSFLLDRYSVYVGNCFDPNKN